MASSPSTQLREQGNEVYRTVTDNLSPVLLKTRLQKALVLYNKAWNLASSDGEKASVAKNIAICSDRLALVSESLGEKKGLIQFYLKEALEYYHHAKTFGRDNSRDWVEGIQLKSKKCWECMKEILEELDTPKKMEYLNVYVPLIADPESQADTFMEIALHYFDAGISALGTKEFLKSLQNLQNTRMPLREAQSLGVEHVTLMAEELEDDVYTQICVAESWQAQYTGDELLKQVLHDEEILNIDIVWEVIDWYKQAILLTRERDIEMEAIACSRLGKLYDQVLKLKARAKVYLSRCLELANSLVPRNITNEDWYITAVTILTRYQEETIRGEEEKKQREREGILQQLKDVLKPLNEKFEACRGGIDSTKGQRIAFLKYIYETHPPKHTDQKLTVPGDQDSITHADLKKLYQKAVVHYHPDKVKVEEHGKDWKVLTEEICKQLTNIYEGYKIP